MCNLDVLRDEYHFFFEFVKPDIVTLRQQCIPRYYLQSPSMFKLIQLLKSSDDMKIGKRISTIDNRMRSGELYRLLHPKVFQTYFYVHSKMQNCIV